VAERKLEGGFEDHLTPAEKIYRFCNDRLEATEPGLADELRAIAQTLEGVEAKAWDQGMGDAKLQALGIKTGVRCPYPILD
jgi:hypothetical protein